MLGGTTTWADDDYVYFGAGSPIDMELLRAPVGGRPPSRRTGAPSGRIDAVTTVGCQVYWLADTDFGSAQAPELRWDEIERRRETGGGVLTEEGTRDSPGTRPPRGTTLGSRE